MPSRSMTGREVPRKEKSRFAFIDPFVMSWYSLHLTPGHHIKACLKLYFNNQNVLKSQAMNTF